jgi:hypothetical protein
MPRSEIFRSSSDLGSSVTNRTPHIATLIADNGTESVQRGRRQGQVSAAYAEGGLRALLQDAYAALSPLAKLRVTQSPWAPNPTGSLVPAPRGRISARRPWPARPIGTEAEKGSLICNSHHLSLFLPAHTTHALLPAPHSHPHPHSPPSLPHTPAFFHARTLSCFVFCYSISIVIISNIPSSLPGASHRPPSFLLITCIARRRTTNSRNVTKHPLPLSAFQFSLFDHKCGF